MNFFIYIILIFLGSHTLNASSNLEAPISPNREIQKSIYTAKNFNYLLGRLPGFSDDLLKLHFTLYQGYVKNVNELLNILDQDANKNLSPIIYASLKRRVGWEFDGMILHELYFENLGESADLSKTSSLYSQIVKDFGSVEKWRADFIATGMMRGIGWVILYYDLKSNHLYNMWIEEHQINHLAGGVPLLVMDVWEHAYLTQYGLKRDEYIAAFCKNIQWNIVKKRFEALGSSLGR